jgi:flagellar protein FliJ
MDSPSFEGFRAAPGSTGSTRGLKPAGARPITGQFMSRFTFTLEAVRSLRERRESQAQESLARELATHGELVAGLQGASSRLDAARSSLPAAGESADGRLLAAQQLFVERREREQALAAALATAQEAEVAARREELTAAAVDRQAIERLRERRLADHLRREAQREQNSLEEIALAGRSRREASA